MSLTAYLKSPLSMKRRTVGSFCWSTVERTSARNAAFDAIPEGVEGFAGYRLDIVQGFAGHLESALSRFDA